MNLQPTIFDYFDEVIHIIDSEHRFIYINKAFIDYCIRLSIDHSVIGKSLETCFSFLPKNTTQEYDTVLKSGLPIITQNEIQINSHHFVSTTQKIPIKDGDEVIAILTMIIDQTLNANIFDRMQKNEKILDMTQELSKMGGWVWNPENRSTFWTAETFRIHGIEPTPGKFDPGDSVELSLGCYNPQDQKKVLDSFNKCCEQGIPYDLEYEFTALDGKKKWIRSKAQPIIEKDGIVSILGAFQDITEDHQNRNKIRQLAEMLDVAPNSIYIVDFEGNFLYANDFACKMHGYTKKEFFQLSLMDINEPGTAKKVEENLKKVRQNEEIRLESIHVRKDGTNFPVLIYTKKVHWDQNLAVLVIGLDLSERKKMEEELLQSRKMDAIGQLSAGIAHDFNNILGSILGMAEIIKEFASLEPDTLEYINNIILDANRGAMLTSKLLSFGRKDKKPFSVININDVVQDVGAILSRSINKMIQIKFDLHAVFSTFLGNYGQIETALLNLGINASQAMEDGGILKFSTCNVEITNESSQSNLANLKPGMFIEITIQDTGIGIPPANLDKLFTPFFTTKEPGKGTGLGLAVTYGTVRDHNGDISVQSQVGKGSVFKIRLPVNKAPNYAATQNLINIRGSGTILLVDDESSIRISGKKMLESFGYSVHLAINGKDAIKYFQDHHAEISLILLDMIMPDMSGVETYHELQKIQKDCKVIVVSGYCREDELMYLKNQGLKGFIQKPYRKDELGIKIKKVLEDQIII